MKEIFKTKRKIVHFSFKGLSLIIFSSFFLLTGCFKEEVIYNTDLPKSGLEHIQLHNFNAPLNGGSLDGSAPDIYYFRQKEDGSYVFMLTSTNYQGFERNWETEYVLVNADATGVIQKTQVMKFPVKDNILGNIARVFEFGYKGVINGITKDITVGPNYVADDKGMLYYKPDLTCICRNVFFNLHPETGQAEYFSTGVRPITAQPFRTSDGGFITIGNGDAPDYHKFSATGTLEFKQPMRYWEASPAYVHLTDRNRDSYFVTSYNGPFGSSVLWFSENTAKSFFYLGGVAYYGNTDVEIRFGPGKTQKAHRFNRRFNFAAGPGWTYLDYVDVPFEVWDLTNNQQLMASFRDQGLDGSFNLVPLNIDWNGYPYKPGPFNDDPNQSLEWIFGNQIPYSSTPSQIIMLGGPLGWPGFLVGGYLTEGAKWDPSALPASSVSLKRGPIPGTQLLKVNANGSSVVKDNYTLGTVPFQNMFKAVPYLNGSAVLINVTSFSVSIPATQLVIMDADFNQTAALNMTFNAADREHQLEYNKEKDRVFYARITSNPKGNADNAYKGSLLLTLIKDNSIKSEKYLDEFIPFRLEKYRMTPTNTGGVAIAAWVRPTKDTRDLLFFELDENLELVKR